MRKLPLGIQTFKEIIENNYLYIDKTGIALKLINNYKYVFLSRPRRFGKSLFVSTLKSLFSGEKELFKNLEAYDKWNWQEKYPVIKIELGGVRTLEELETSINLNMIEIIKRYNLNVDTTLPSSSILSEVLKDLKRKLSKNVVILIDEYDKPILDNIDQIEVAVALRETLKLFYSQIKQNDEHIKFCLLTGVSRFSKISLFSGLNNLTDISLNGNYGNICGYTQNDLETSFKEYLQSVDMEEVKKWYNGYNFLGERVYNPYDILLFIDSNFEYRNYWFSTGTPSFLLKLIQQKQYFTPKLDNFEADSNILDSFDVEQIDLETIMFQAGYLTIDKVINKRNRFVYKLKFPNLEVKNSFTDVLLNTFVDKWEKNSIADELYTTLANSNMEELRTILERLFSSISYHNYSKNEIAKYEGFYASVIYAYLYSLGLEVVAEDVTNKGRIDTTVKYENKIYIFEFKVLNEDPLKQIKEKRYYEKYKGEIYLIGINFNPKTKNIEKFKWEKL